MSQRLINRNLLRRPPPHHVPRQHRPNLRHNMLISHHPAAFARKNSAPCANTPSRLSTKNRDRLTSSLSTSAGPAKLDPTTFTCVPGLTHSPIKIGSTADVSVHTTSASATASFTPSTARTTTPNSSTSPQQTPAPSPPTAPTPQSPPAPAPTKSPEHASPPAPIPQQRQPLRILPSQRVRSDRASRRRPYRRNLPRMHHANRRPTLRIEQHHHALVRLHALRKILRIHADQLRPKAFPDPMPPGITPNIRPSPSGTIDRSSCTVSPRENAIIASRTIGKHAHTSAAPPLPRDQSIASRAPRSPSRRVHAGPPRNPGRPRRTYSFPDDFFTRAEHIPIPGDAEVNAPCAVKQS